MEKNIQHYIKLGIITIFLERCFQMFNDYFFYLILYLQNKMQLFVLLVHNQKTLHLPLPIPLSDNIAVQVVQWYTLSISGIFQKTIYRDVTKLFHYISYETTFFQHILQSPFWFELFSNKFCKVHFSLNFMNFLSTNS